MAISDIRISEDTLAALESRAEGRLDPHGARAQALNQFLETVRNTISMSHLIHVLGEADGRLGSAMALPRSQEI